MNTHHSDLQNLSRVFAKSPGGPIGHHDFDGDDPSWAVVAKEMIHRTPPNDPQTAPDGQPIDPSQMQEFFRALRSLSVKPVSAKARSSRSS